MFGSRSKICGMCERIMWPRNTYFSNPKCYIRNENKNRTQFEAAFKIKEQHFSVSKDRVRGVGDEEICNINKFISKTL
jgi:hypothetical protein